MSEDADDISQILHKYLKKEVEIHAFDTVYKGRLKSINHNLSITLKDETDEIVLPIERIESVRCLK
ncbi:MAG: hypothetical protein A3I75_00040 [Deltaproteobacteria bacterium RIFCSPLOWO2_02_FULL_50_16]|nr:MAG: hypothetical protein A2053_04870 [Deltaproteobacteria bacterium GWA2_50_8]OGQ27522.1 MAG: hypothetical protein A3B79_07605 [Deltaproteobacteria bacterium RIFCSPHIGHO2_02_FULL_50_15]OGQ58184.1 MAG: hypothetical protein A3I75_00040 [Deltaproteobacteria bacterium RIFCSPLOWO2_02_FULL_50_16]OGQ66863.1 MAG: hypothetical protein A3F89_06360 [Deltaproteobacteria bacterium RIFCSPLOWO2_12_FULL_50_11]